MSIQSVPFKMDLEYINKRHERIEEVKEEVRRPVNEISVTRSLHQHGFNFNDLTDVEKIDLFV